MNEAFFGNLYQETGLYTSILNTEQESMGAHNRGNFANEEQNELEYENFTPKHCYQDDEEFLELQNRLLKVESEVQSIAEEIEDVQKLKSAEINAKEILYSMNQAYMRLNEEISKAAIVRENSFVSVEDNSDKDPEIELLQKRVSLLEELNKQQALEINVMSRQIEGLHRASLASRKQSIPNNNKMSELAYDDEFNDK